MDRRFDEELERLKTDLLKMATLTEESIHRSFEALQTGDKELAHQVIKDDEIIDQYENRIEEFTIDLLALFQPMAKDLRFITTGMRFNTELERISDITVNICQRVMDLNETPDHKAIIDISRLTENAKWMVKGAIDAFVRRDQSLAQRVIAFDKNSNELRNVIIDELVNDFMKINEENISHGVTLLLIARDLERMCDHATYIAEDVIYMVQAKMVKHKR
jgi:phosphate transport system protein